MSDLQVAAPITSTGIGGIDYDLLAAALLRQGAVGDGFPVGSRQQGLKGKLSPVAVAVPKVAGGGVGGGVGVVAMNAGGSGKVETAVSEDSFGAIPQSDGMDSDSGSSVVSVQSGGSLSGGLPGEVSDAVRSEVRFGGIVDAYGSGGQPGGSTVPGFCAMTSRRAQTKQLANALKELMDAKVPKAAMIELGMCTYTAGSMPDMVKDGAAKLRSLAAVGDAAVTLHVTAGAYAGGMSVRSAQSARSRLTSDVNMGLVMKNTGLYRFITYPPGVDPFTSSASATAFEAIVGVLVLYRSFEGVKAFLNKVGIA